MNWFILSLITAFLWGIGQVLLKKSLSNLSAFWNNIIDGFSFIIIFIPYSFLLSSTVVVNFQILFLLLIIAYSYISFYYAIEKADVSLSGTVVASYPIVTIVLSILFLSEKLSFLQIISIFLIIAGNSLLAYTPTKNKKNHKNWIVWAIAALVLNGFADFLAKITINISSIKTYFFLFPFAYLFSAMTMYFFDKAGRKLPKKITFANMKYSLIGIPILTLGFVAFNTSLSTGPLGLVSAITSAYAAITVILAYFFLKEKLSTVQRFAIVLVLIGIIAINF